MGLPQYEAITTLRKQYIGAQTSCQPKLLTSLHGLVAINLPRLHKESPEWVKLRRNARRLREELMVERVGPPDNRPVLEAVIFICVCLQTNLLNFGIDWR